jgi:hypothetical protein
MNMLAQHNALSRELERFFVVSKMYREEAGGQAFMPACPVDTEWHRMLDSPKEYKVFCQKVLGREVLHKAAKGEGEIGWSGIYERQYGPIPEVWFRDITGTLRKTQRRKYLEKGVFYASWDCTPY